MYSVSDSQSALNVGRNVTEPQIAVWTVRFARCFKCHGFNFMLSQKNLWPTFTTRGTLTEEISAQVFSKERRRLQAQHLWMVVNLKWGVLVDRMYVKAPTGKSKEDLDDALLFDRVARRNRTDPYDEKKYRGAGLKEVQTWWKTCKDWMAR